MLNKVNEFIWRTKPGIKGVPKTLLLALAEHANLKGQAAPSMKEIICMMGVKPRAAQDALRKLEKTGHITIVEGQGVATSTGKTNLYIFIGFTDWYKVNKGMQDGAKSYTPPMDKGMQNHDEPTPTGMQNQASRDAKPSIEGMQKDGALEVLKDKVSAEVKDSVVSDDTTTRREVTVGKAKKRQKPVDPAFEIVARHIFEFTDPTEIPDKVARNVDDCACGLSKWFRDKFATDKRLDIMERVVKGFVGDYRQKYKGASLPSNGTSFRKHFIPYGQKHEAHITKLLAESERPAAVETPPAPVPTITTLKPLTPEQNLSLISEARKKLQRSMAQRFEVKS